MGRRGLVGVGSTNRNKLIAERGRGGPPAPVNLLLKSKEQVRAAHLCARQPLPPNLPPPLIYCPSLAVVCPCLCCSMAAAAVCPSRLPP